MLPPSMPPLSPLEELVADCYDIHDGSFDEQCERVRRWLRAEIDQRLREAAKKERVEVACRICGAPTDVSQSHAEKLVNGRFALPLCLDCRSPAKTAEADAEVVAFVECLPGPVRDEVAAGFAVLA